MAGRNGERKPPRPRIEVISGPATDAEAAAIAAALEHFIADTAPAPDPTGPQQSPWQRAALEEGISARQLAGAVWGPTAR